MRWKARCSSAEWHSTGPNKFPKRWRSCGMVPDTRSSKNRLVTRIRCSGVIWKPLAARSLSRRERRSCSETGVTPCLVSFIHPGLEQADDSDVIFGMLGERTQRADSLVSLRFETLLSIEPYADKSRRPVQQFCCAWLLTHAGCVLA